MSCDIPWTISQSSQLAVLLEVSAPKPGNVNRDASFSDIDYRHFLTSATLIGKGIYHAASQGVLLANGVIDPEEVQLGELILETAIDAFTDMNKHNTILGTILLHIPIAVAMAAAISEKTNLDTMLVINYLRSVINSTTVEDTINLYKALHLVNPSGDKHKTLDSWTDQHSRYDLDNPDVYDNIRTDGVSLGELFRLSSKVDRICEEWSSYYHSTLFETLPALRKTMHGLIDAEEAIVEVFVWRLSLEPDSHIIKRAGITPAKEVQKAARETLQTGLKGIEQLQQLDKILRAQGNLLNPGTTADLLSTALFCRLVELRGQS
ncbi:MAG: triphosphoribosyl-dephospho-CoA synthase [Candidatus Thorarchaeota archaeon]